jgi:GDPmannose 4,6-dehydratase
MKKAIVIGHQGQDGRILFEQLEQENYSLLGLGRECSKSVRMKDYAPVNILDSAQVESVVADLKPDEIYYLAAFHHSSEEFLGADVPALWQKSFDVHVRGAIHFLEAMKKHSPRSRFFYAASALVFGEAKDEPQNEDTPLRPQCIYGITKTAGIHACRFYRSNGGIFASAGVLYNHESRFRAKKFVSQKILQAALNIKKQQEGKLVLGDLSARIDWGYAPDFVRAMRAILSASTADDFVIATGETHTVREFVEIAFGLLGLDWTRHVEEKPGLIERRRSILRGDASKLARLTKWQRTVTFEQMVERLLKESDETV